MWNSSRTLSRLALLLGAATLWLAGPEAQGQVEPPLEPCQDAAPVSRSSLAELATDLSPLSTPVREDWSDLSASEGFQSRNDPRAWQRRTFTIPCALGQNPEDVKVEMSGGTGDADLYVRLGAAPTLTAYDGRPYIGGNNEDVELADPCASAGGGDSVDLHVAVRAYSPFSGVRVDVEFEVPDAGETVEPCISSSRRGNGLEWDAVQRVLAAWHDPVMGRFHQLWHAFQNGAWDRLSAAQRRQFAREGWGPPADANGQGRRHTPEEIALDFYCMHDGMVDATQQLFNQAREQLGLPPCQLMGWHQGIPWGDGDNPESDQNFPITPWRNQTQQPRFKTQAGIQGLKRRIADRAENPEWLSTVSFADAMVDTEGDAHNFFHGMFAQTAPDGSPCPRTGQTGSELSGHPNDPEGRTAYLFSTCSSQGNINFWKLHVWVDQRASDWVLANARPGQPTTATIKSGLDVEIPARETVESWTPDEMEEFVDDMMSGHDCWRGPMPSPSLPNNPLGGLMVRSMALRAGVPETAAESMMDNNRAKMERLDAAIAEDPSAERTIEEFSNFNSSFLPSALRISQSLNLDQRDLVLKYLAVARRTEVNDVAPDGVGTVKVPLLTAAQYDVLRRIAEAPDAVNLDVGDLDALERGLIRLQGSRSGAAKAIRATLRKNAAIMAQPHIARYLTEESVGTLGDE